jgi:hypothetical protein
VGEQSLAQIALPVGFSDVDPVACRLHKKFGMQRARPTGSFQLLAVLLASAPKTGEADDTTVAASSEARGEEAGSTLPAPQVLDSSAEL